VLNSKKLTWLITKNLLKEERSGKYAKIVELIEYATGLIVSNKPDQAIWRLIDAVGELSKDFPNSIGIKMPTGKGYQIKGGNYSTTKITQINPPKYSTPDKISQDLSKLLVSMYADNYSKFVENVKLFNEKYSLSLKIPTTADIRTFDRKFKWEDGESLTKEQIAERWRKATNSNTYLSFHAKRSS
jgi:hypothetical protein